MASNDILDSWEDFTDYEAPNSGKTKKKIQPGSAAEGSSNVVVTEESHRTQYKPQIRILKREPQDNKRNATVDSMNSNNGLAVDNPSDAKPKAKTLAQREAEYAEARRRILGPSYNPEEQQQQQPQLPPQQQPLTTSVPPPLVPPFPPPPPSIADLVPPYPPPPILPHPNHIHPPPPQPSSSNYDDNSPRRLAQRMENLKMNAVPGVMVVRQPNGPDPDGFRGFSGYKSDMRR